MSVCFLAPFVGRKPSTTVTSSRLSITSSQSCLCSSHHFTASAILTGDQSRGILILTFSAIFDSPLIDQLEWLPRSSIFFHNTFHSCRHIQGQFGFFQFPQTVE